MEPSSAAMLSLLAPPAAAQFFNFGQNKIQYRKLDWRVLRGPHVDLYYYPAEAELAPAALAYAEASYDTLAVQFGHDVAAPHPAHRLRLAHRLRADQHPAVHSARRPARRDRLPEAPGVACRSAATSPSSATRCGTSWCTCSSSTSSPRATTRRRGRAGSTCRSGGPKGWPSSGRAGRTRGTRWSCATSR